VADGLAPLHRPSRVHLDEIAGPLGIYQHASGEVPNQAFGYCTDDVARALIVDLEQLPGLGWPAVESSVRRGLHFLREAFVPDLGVFRNQRSADGTWLPLSGAEEDASSRATLALARATAELPTERLRAEAAELLERAWPAMRGLEHVRPRATAVLAATAGALVVSTRAIEDAGRLLAGLRVEVGRAAGDDERWPWPEPILTYESALVPRALIAGGAFLHDWPAIRLGLRVLDWLTETSIDPQGKLIPVGNRGWWPRGGDRARFDQQPIEATSLLLAAEAAFDVTGEASHLAATEACYGWFLGANSAGVPVADPRRGSCHDGLSPHGVNSNQGAESTLMWLQAAARMPRLRALALARPSTQSSPSTEGPTGSPEETVVGEALVLEQRRLL
jgi:hypothetical protein